MAKAREIAGLRSEDRFAAVAARVVSARADELLEHSEGVLDTGDIERVHAMRVASRRLRAAMEVFAPCFPRKPFKTALKEVKEIADALGERRDRDVSIDALRGFGEALSDADRRGVLMMVERLREEQSLANERLAPVVERSAPRAAARPDRGADRGRGAGRALEGAQGQEARPRRRRWGRTRRGSSARGSRSCARSRPRPWSPRPPRPSTTCASPRSGCATCSR